MALRSRRPNSDIIWPGFVDALSSLLMVIIFLLSLFALAQFFLGQALSGRDEALASLRATLAELNQALAAERATAEDLRDQIGALRLTIGGLETERDTLTDRVAGLEQDMAETVADLNRARTDLAGTQAALDVSRSALERQRELTRASRADVSRLQLNITGLRQQLADLQAALDAADAKDQAQQAQIVDLGRRLNRALAQKVTELSAYRSEFFGQLRALLGDRDDVRVEGERFIFQSELLFDSGSADLGPEGRAQMQTVAAALIAISQSLPPELNWVLRIDGHTDRRPIATAQFASNWELSAQRAISVVKFLASEGVPPDRLAATGFGEFQPLADGDDPVSLRRNRRIEIRFTQR